MERGNRLADQLDHLVRAGRPMAQETQRGYAAEPDNYVADDMVSSADADGAEPRVRSRAERELLKALRMAR